MLAQFMRQAARTVSSEHQDSVSVYTRGVLDHQAERRFSAPGCGGILTENRADVVPDRELGKLEMSLCSATSVDMAETKRPKGELMVAKKRKERVTEKEVSGQE